MKLGKTYRTGLMAFIGITLLVAIVGCSGSNNAAESPNPPSESGSESPKTSDVKPKLEYWTIRSQGDIDKMKEDILKDVMNEVDLTIVPIPSAELDSKLRIALAGNNAPDVFDVDGVYTSNYAYSGYLKPLDEYWDNTDYEDYVQSSKDKTTFDGKKYAASLFETSLVLFYNKDHFAKADITDIPTSVTDAWTYDEYVAAAQKLTLRDDSGKVIQYGAMPDWTAPDITNEAAVFGHWMFLWNNGGEVLNPEKTTAKGFLDSANTIKALQAYQDYFQKNKVSPLESITKDLYGFEVGKLSMYTANIQSVYLLRTKYPDIQFGVMPLPKGANHYGSSGGWNIGINSGTKNADGAWKVIEAITGKEGHRKYTETFNFIPSRKSALEAIPALQEYPFSIAREMMRNSRARPVTPAYAEISPIFGEMMSAIAYGEDPTEWAKKTTNNIDKILQKYAK